MFEFELDKLFNEKEIEEFYSLLYSKHIVDFLSKEKYWYSEYIQEFISIMEDNERKQEILEICVNQFPQIIGYSKENI